MTTERTEGPTPAGGDYAIATYVDLATLEEVDRDAADGMIVTEYDAGGAVLLETVAKTVHAASP